MILFNNKTGVLVKVVAKHGNQVWVENLVTKADHLIPLDDISRLDIENKIENFVREHKGDFEYLSDDNSFLYELLNLIDGTSE